MDRRSASDQAIARSNVQHAPRKFAQARRIEQLDLAAVDRDELLFAKPAEYATHRFRGKAQVVGDVGARHAEPEFGARQSARGVAVAQIDEERGKALVRGMITGQQRGRAKLLAEQPEQVLLDLGLACGQRAHRGEREAAAQGGLQRDRVARVVLGIDRVQAHEFARQVEAQYLLTAFGVHQGGLDHAGAHREQRAEWVAGAKHALAGLERADVLDEAMQVVQLGSAVTRDRTGFGERATRAEVLGVAVVARYAGVARKRTGLWRVRFHEGVRRALAPQPSVMPTVYRRGRSFWLRAAEEPSRAKADGVTPTASAGLPMRTPQAAQRASHMDVASLRSKRSVHAST